MKDKQRLDWLEKQAGAALINDDFGSWAFASNGFQNIPGTLPNDICTTHIVEKHAWQPTIREAIDLVIDKEEK